jgi:hypothetical protein
MATPEGIEPPTLSSEGRAKPESPSVLKSLRSAAGAKSGPEWPSESRNSHAIGHAQTPRNMKSKPLNITGQSLGFTADLELVSFDVTYLEERHVTTILNRPYQDATRGKHVVSFL